MKKERKRVPVMERLMKRVKLPLDENGKQDDTKCWLWTGVTNNAGYGMLRVSTDVHMATVHRIMYIETFNTVKYGDKVEVQHTCGNKLCVNPKHLQLGDIVSRHILQAKYNAYNKMMSHDREKMWPVCEHCGESTYLPHFERLHRLCKREAKYKYITEQLSKKVSK
jgi:hypothetical protein